MLLPFRRVLPLICLFVVCAYLCARVSLRMYWRQFDLRPRSESTDVTRNVNRTSTRDMTLNTTDDVRPARVPQAACVLVRFTDVTAAFRSKLSQRSSGQTCSDPDFLDLVRTLRGRTPRLLSKRRRFGSEDERIGRENVVPNLVHYVHFGRGMKFTFVVYLSYLSVNRFIKPDYIFLHGDTLPAGAWWERTLEDVPNIYHVHVRGILGIRGKRFRFPTQHSNLLRLHIMLDYGGIYLDHDVIVVKSFDALRGDDFTMGRPLPYALNNGIMLGRRGAPFAQLWLETYRSPSLNLRHYGYESVRTAHALSTLFPHLVRVEDDSLAQPNYRHAELFYRDPYDWSANYAVHVMGETAARIPMDVNSLRGYDCMLGEVMRFVYFGDSKLLSNNTWKGLK